MITFTKLKVGIVIFILSSPCLALENSFKPLIPTAAEQTLKIDAAGDLHESKLSRVIRDSGIGLGAGALGGLSFVILSQGRLPNGTKAFDNEALTTGLLVG